MSELTDEFLSEARTKLRANQWHRLTPDETFSAVDELIALRAERVKIVAQHAEDKRLWTADMRALKEAAQPAEAGRRTVLMLESILAN